MKRKNEKDANALETVRSLFSAKTKDFITAVDEKNIILVQEVKPGETYGDLEKTANTILDMLNTEADVQGAYCLRYHCQRDQGSFPLLQGGQDGPGCGKDLLTARKNVIAYSNLGIGRLIYQLPLPLCKMFIKEIFDGKITG